MHIMEIYHHICITTIQYMVLLVLALQSLYNVNCSYIW